MISDYYQLAVASLDKPFFSLDEGTLSIIPKGPWVCGGGSGAGDGGRRKVRLVGLQASYIYHIHSSSALSFCFVLEFFKPTN